MHEAAAANDQQYGDPRRLDRLSYLLLLLAAALVVGGWMAELANMPGG